jgi:hypothetical protein
LPACPWPGTGTCGYLSANAADAAVHHAVCHLPRSSTDLAIAASVLAANGAVPAAALAGLAFVAELGLDGHLRPVCCQQARVAAVVEGGMKTVVLAAGDAAEVPPGVRVIAAQALAEAASWLRAGSRETHQLTRALRSASGTYVSEIMISRPGRPGLADPELAGELHGLRRDLVVQPEGVLTYYLRKPR